MSFYRRHEMAKPLMEAPICTPPGPAPAYRARDSAPGTLLVLTTRTCRNTEFVPKLSNVPGHDTAQQKPMTVTVLESSLNEAEQPARLLRRFLRSKLALFFGLLTLILVLKWSTLTEPPLWDAAMSVFPAAITLEEHGFDYGFLLSQPGYSDGGPNVHSLSPITLVTALAVRLIGDGPSLFPVLHFIHFAIAAFAFTGVFRLSEMVLGRRLAAAVTFSALIFPLVLTQVGFMYLEIAMLAAFVYALLAWHRGSVVTAAAWSTLAVLVKASGIIIAVALAGVALFDPRPERRSAKNALVVAITPLLAMIGQAVAGTPSGIPDIQGHMTLVVTYLASVPDLAFIVLALLIVSTVSPPWRKSELRKDDQATNIQVTTTFVLVAFIAFYLAIPFFGLRSPVLPRYYVAIFPVALMGLVAVIQRRFSVRTAVLALVVLSIISVVNRDGTLYPQRDNEAFPIAERSGAYRDLLELQFQGTTALIEAGRSGPVFYAQPEHYRFNYPLMGYASGPLPDGHSIEHELPYREARLTDFPDSFVMLFEFDWLGGEEIQEVWDQAAVDPTRSVVVTTITAGDYASSLIKVTTKGGD